MLVLPLKTPYRFDVRSALAAWLDDSASQVSYKPKNPLELVLPKPDFRSCAVREELLRLQSLRNCVCDAVLKAGSHAAAIQESALPDCHEYAAAVLEFEKRGFPATDDSAGRRDYQLQLKWKGAFDAVRHETHGSFTWDRCCVLFDAAALRTAQAAACPVADRDACKRAVSYYQEAAGVLFVLREIAQSQDYATVDLSQSMLSFWIEYCSAAAQVNIYRMASLAGGGGGAAAAQHATLAHLAQAAYKMLSDALVRAREPRLVSEVPGPAAAWGAHCKAACHLCAAKAVYHTAVVHRLSKQWGYEIARLRECDEKVTACLEFCATVDSDAAPAVQYSRKECLTIQPVVQDRLTEAVRDNHAVYQDEIPTFLPEILSKRLAKNAADTGLPNTMLVPKKALFVNV